MGTERLIPQVWAEQLQRQLEPSPFERAYLEAAQARWAALPRRTRAARRLRSRLISLRLALASRIAGYPVNPH